MQARLDFLEIPSELNRNAPEVAALGADNTGEILLGYLARAFGAATLANLRVLDIGCGVRFTSAIINRRVPIGKYIGVENSKPVFDFLSQHVEPFDDRFEFKFWDARNEMYSKNGKHLAEESFPKISAPVDIVSMFSVITHQYPEDARKIFEHARSVIGGGGKLYFTAFVDQEIEGFRDMFAEKPLLKACYDPPLMESLLAESGWRIERIEPVSKLTQTRFTCLPA